VNRRRPLGPAHRSVCEDLMTLLLEPTIVRAGGKPPGEMYEDTPARPASEEEEKEEERE
jgi:hypothetical protein